jgi:penicillin-binding protein 1C
MQGMSGYRGGARVVSVILRALDPSGSQGLGDVGLPSPQDWTPVALCPFSGDLATPECDAALTELFPPSAIPTHNCTAHRREAGRVVVDLPPRYHSWMDRAGIPRAARAALTRPEDPVEIAILSPRDGTKVVRDPEVPAERATLRLEATVDPPVDQLLWVVDGQPFALVEPPYVTRWPVEPGAHRIEARLPYREERSMVMVEAR